MIKKLPLFLAIVLTIINVSAFSQSVTETEVFTLTYEGEADAYSFIADSNSTNYCYFYRDPDAGKTFIISNNSTSEKFDYAGPEDLKFDANGNYFTVTSNMRADYGIDNYFLVVNGKVVRNYDYMESYSSYFNKKGDYVFIFKENELYKIGSYNYNNNTFTQSEGYENLRPLYKFVESYGGEEGSESYSVDNYYYNVDGERGFVGNKNGKTDLIFESSIIPTDYSDINETSLTLNKNNELSYIAKRGGKFYEKIGNEFVVSGSKEYASQEIATVPLFFDNNNEPVYVAGDSISDTRNIYFIMTGSSRQRVTTENSTLPLSFTNYPSNVVVNPDGTINYFGMYDTTIAGKKTKDNPEGYDKYYNRTYFVKNGKAYELGYNTMQVKYNSRGEMLYSGIVDLKKDERLLLMNYGSSRIILNKKKFDDIYEYGFSPDGQIYYVGQNYGNPEKNTKDEGSLILGDKEIGDYAYYSFQYMGNNNSIIVFDGNKYAYVAGRYIDSITSDNIIVDQNGVLPFPKTSVAGINSFSYVSSLMYSANGKMFYVGSLSKPDLSYTVNEAFINNESTGKLYSNLGIVRYDKTLDRTWFYGARGKSVYRVDINF